MGLTIDHFEPELPIGEIDVADTNVRKTGQTKGLDELMDSIKEFGLFQPVTVFAKGTRYKLLVGQRRYLACRKLGWTTIPAFIVKSMSEKNQTIVSFGENVHRNKLPYEDSIQVCNKLYDEYSGTKKARVKKIAEDLGISTYLVAKYLAHVLVPKQLRDWVEAGKLSEDFAYRLTATHYPDNEKIISIANKALKMTRAEAQRILEFSKRDPKASVDEILNYAKNPPPLIKLVIHLEPDTSKRMLIVAKSRKQSMESFVKDAIDKSLEEG